MVGPRAAPATAAGRASEPAESELRAVCGDGACEAACVAVGDVDGGEAVLGWVEDDEVEACGHTDGVGGLRGEVPL